MPEGGTSVRYAIRQVPGVVQFSASSRDDALRLARRFAQRQSVDVWHAGEGMIRLLEVYRR
jgi:hypothetical protein